MTTQSSGTQRQGTNGTLPFFMGWGRVFSVIILVMLLVFSHSQPINFTNVDLGRHLKNGEVTLAQGGPTSTNYYSYTEPQRESINHHWATGVLFYFIERTGGGIQGVSLFYLLLRVITILLFLYSATLISNYATAYFFTVLSIPLLVSRLDPRPEGISYFMMAAIFLIGTLYKNGKISGRWLFVIPLLQILWVNCHLFFPLGVFLTSVFYVEEWLNKREKRKLKVLGGVILLQLFACLVNPYGIKGALIPLKIFENYGYQLAENQSVIFMQHRFPQNWEYVQFEILFFLLAGGFVALLTKDRLAKHVSVVLIFMLCSLVSWKVIRGIPLFGLFYIPVSSYVFYKVIAAHSGRVRLISAWVLLLVGVVLCALGLTGQMRPYSPYERLLIPAQVYQDKNSIAKMRYVLGHIPEMIGLIPGVNASAEFFKENRLRGPVFNNYDIGSYLIYHLFPKERVFVDNRPESYSTAFFKDIYIPMQENEDVWKKMDELYKFNVIFFYRRDITPWAQPFLIKRIVDLQWVPVFADDFSLILVKRAEQNAEVIRKHELPKNIFSVKITD